MNFPMVALGEVLAERREEPSSHDLETGKIRIVAKVGFNDGEIRVREDGKTKTGMILIRPGDLVVSGINAAKGAIAVYKEENTNPIAATIHYGAYIPNKDRVDIKFIWRLLRSRTFRDILLEYVPGGIKTELKAKRLLPIPIPLPPLPEQRRIVARIEELEEKIGEARGLRRKMGEEMEALYMAALRRQREDLLKNHPTEKIGSITQITAGGTPLRDVSIYWGGNIPWIKTGELIDRDIYQAEEHITKDGLENSSAKLFPRDTILIALYGQGQTRGRTGRLMIEATTNQACCAILPTPSIFESRFIQYWLRSLYTEMREESRDGAQPNWNGQMMKNIVIAIPPLSEQRRIVAYLDELQAKVDALRHLQAEIGAEMDALLPAVLDKAFKGEM